MFENGQRLYAESRQWLDDEPPLRQDGSPSMDEAAPNGVRPARMKSTDTLVYLGCSLPALEDFPAWADLLELHRELVEAKAIAPGSTQANFPEVTGSRPETLQKVRELVKLLEDRLTLKTRLASHAHQPWLESLTRRFAELSQEDPLLQAMFTVCADIRTLDLQRRSLLAKAIIVPSYSELHDDFIAAVARLVVGKSAFAYPFGKNEARKMMGAVTIMGIAPQSQDDWKLVEETLCWRMEARKALARWAPLSVEFGLEIPRGDVESAFRQLALWQAGIADVRQMSFTFNAVLPACLENIFGKKAVARSGDNMESFLEMAHASLQACLDRARLDQAMQRVRELAGKLDDHRGGIVEALRSFLSESLGNAALDETTLQRTWLALQAELSRLTCLQPANQTAALGGRRK